MPSARRFQPPWVLDGHPECFIVHDANGHALAYVYFEEEPGQRSAANVLRLDKAKTFSWPRKAWEGIMAVENFSDNLLRAVAAELHLLNRVTAAREMFSKSYFSLGVVEKATVDQTVMSMVAGIYQSFTPEALAARKAQEPIGFRASEETKP